MNFIELSYSDSYRPLQYRYCRIPQYANVLQLLWCPVRILHGEHFSGNRRFLVDVWLHHRLALMWNHHLSAAHKDKTIKIFPRILCHLIKWFSPMTCSMLSPVKVKPNRAHIHTGCTDESTHYWPGLFTSRSVGLDIQRSPAAALMLNK